MEIKDIKAKLSITQVLAYYGITVIKNKQVNCLFHDDKTPSMQVYEDKGLVYCHSSNCKNAGKHLDQIEIIQQKENCTKHEAIKKAQSLITGISITPVKPMLTEPINFHELLPKLQQNFIKSDKAITYAKERNINHAKLNIGYNPINTTLYKALKNCIVFPLKDESGNITSLYGRSIDIMGYIFCPFFCFLHTPPCGQASVKPPAGRSFAVFFIEGLPPSNSRMLYFR